MFVGLPQVQYHVVGAVFLLNRRLEYLNTQMHGGAHVDQIIKRSVETM
jgi:hypothetical protein